MTAKLLAFPKGGEPQKKQHVVKQLLDDSGQSVAWLAAELHVTTGTLYNFFNHKSELKKRTYVKMLKLLGIDDNYVYGVGKYARAREGVGLSTNIS